MLRPGRRNTLSDCTLTLLLRLPLHIDKILPNLRVLSHQKLLSIARITRKGSDSYFLSVSHHDKHVMDGLFGVESGCEEVVILPGLVKDDLLGGFFERLKS